MAGKNVAAVVEEMLRPTVKELGYALWDVEYVKMGAEWHLIVTIDKPEGINIEDCERVHRAIDPILDEQDPIENSYRLEVSSPGVERDLKRETHFLSSIGLRVKVRLFRPINGSKALIGTLLGYQGGAVSLTLEDGSEMTLERGVYSKVETLFFD